ncbi:hemolysin family protein [Paenibacillus alkalitolerans]|uniref:hemolysin family protein n=1 Tax=Paenibacillus alkalitolerans TaxID=2799335 RepID=UPI0018F36095|nr:hemolysin family protein [Paenibacillus alkalitolerans]
MPYIFEISAIILLIAATAFFVATEFAIIKLRPSRIDQLVADERRNALSLRKVTTNLDGYLSACQLGITMTALGLGWLGEPTIESVLHGVFVNVPLPPGVTDTVSFVLAFAIVTFLHVVAGELAPKTLAIQKAEPVALATARPIIAFYTVMYPFIWFLNSSATWLVRLFGLRPASEHEEAHSEEELQIILNESYKSGKINQAEYGYVSRIFAFDDLVAREIMVPRTDMFCLYAEKPLEENIAIMKREQYTRFPVAKENKDQIIGFVNTKEFFLGLDDDPNVKLESFIHPVLTVPEMTHVQRLLKMMQAKREHMALLTDEYGGTSGLITIEDILEEIVGEIRDEFDAEEKLEIESLGSGRLLVDGKVSLTHLSDFYGISIDYEDADTIGGWLLSQMTEPKKGSEIQYEGNKFIIREKDRHRIRRVEIVIDATDGEPNYESLQ